MTPQLLSTFPSTNYVPIKPMNSPKLWDSSTIHHIQNDGKLTEIWWMRRRNGLWCMWYIFMDSSHNFLKPKQTILEHLHKHYEQFFFIFSRSLWDAWHFGTKLPRWSILEKAVKHRTPWILLPVNCTVVVGSATVCILLELSMVLPPIFVIPVVCIPVCFP